jgi:hypothetical protein
VGVPHRQQRRQRVGAEGLQRLPPGQDGPHAAHLPAPRPGQPWVRLDGLAQAPQILAELRPMLAP